MFCHSGAWFSAGVSESTLLPSGPWECGAFSVEMDLAGINLGSPLALRFKCRSLAHLFEVPKIDDALAVHFADGVNCTNPAKWGTQNLPDVATKAFRATARVVHQPVPRSILHSLNLLRRAD